jgi:uncharacterized membrane protein
MDDFDKLEQFEKEMHETPDKVPSEKKKPKEEKIYYIADFKGLCDLVNVNGEVKFLTLDGQLLDETVVNDKFYRPPKIERLAFDLPNYSNIEPSVTEFTDVSDGQKHTDVSSKDKELFDKILEFHKESAELPDERLYILVTAWDIHTHLLEKFGHSPIIFFAGLPEKGKSRMATSMLCVARRGVRKASVSDAQIIREASDHGATIFFDMTNFWISIQKSGSEDVVLSRFERGLKVARVLNPDKGAFEDMTYFNVFGATIIASNDSVDQVLGSRTVSIIMRQSKKKFEKLVDEKKGKKLRDKLVAFRLKHFDSKLPETEKIVSGRFGDIIKPLHQIVKFIRPDYENDFIELIKDLDKKRQMTKSNTLEGEIIQTILKVKDTMYHNLIPVKAITDEMNKEKSDREKVTYQKIGRRLDIMGFQKGFLTNGASAIEWNDSLIESLSFEHNIAVVDETSVITPFSVTSVTSVSSSSSDNDTMGIAEDIFS